MSSTSQFKRKVFDGKDNYGKPKKEYVDRLAAMSDEQLYEETKTSIWLSAYAANNPRSDYHWHADACYDECLARDNSDLYCRAFEAVRAG